MAEERHPLHDLFEDQIKDLYSAENQIIKALPKMAKNATSPQLRAAFEKHLEETRDQVARLEQIARRARLHAEGQEVQGRRGADRRGQGSDGGVRGRHARRRPDRRGAAASSTTRLPATAPLAPTRSCSAIPRRRGCSSRRSTKRAGPTRSSRSLPSPSSTSRRCRKPRRIWKFGNAECGNLLRFPHFQISTFPDHFESTSAKNSSALGSFDWPSQNIACLRTAGFWFVFATLISSGTPSSFGS